MSDYAPGKTRKCQRCQRTRDIRAFPYANAPAVCVFCLNRERTDRANGQTNIYDLTGSDGLDYNEIALPRDAKGLGRYAAKRGNRFQ